MEFSSRPIHSIRSYYLLVVMLFTLLLFLNACAGFDDAENDIFVEQEVVDGPSDGNNDGQDDESQFLQEMLDLSKELADADDEIVVEEVVVDQGASDDKTNEEYKLIRIIFPNRILFDFDEYTIHPEVDPFLKALADRLRISSPDLIVMAVGHTDDRGEALYNLNLGEKRAEATLNRLVAEQIPQRNLFKMSLGEWFPIGENNTKVGSALNRRVELLVGTVQEVILVWLRSQIRDLCGITSGSQNVEVILTAKSFFNNGEPLHIVFSPSDVIELTKQCVELAPKKKIVPLKPGKQTVCLGSGCPVIGGE